jgi:hypothetical protein
MIIGEEEIVTPEEDRAGYEPDWRWRAAAALLRLEAAGGRATVTADAQVWRLARSLGAKKVRSSRPAPLDRARRWHESGFGEIAKAFVLACGSVAGAAAEMGVAHEDVAAYCHCFFDVFDAEGRLRAPAVMKIRARALADNGDPAQQVRTAALRLGLPGLRSLLGHRGTDCAAAEKPTLDQMVESELQRRLAAGELRTGDLIRLKSCATARERAEAESGGASAGAALESVRAMQQIMALTAPRLVTPDTDPGKTRSTDEAVRARFEAQRNTGSACLPDDDPGKAAEALDAMIHARFKTKDENDNTSNASRLA